ncbi:MAG: helix-turn-helix transcriptional regulator [Planctomycetes bacterium]|nr:helix-turn-helix transcriptional regulator [Planctomycetota bacterium]
MTQLATVLREEIRRLSRRELSADIASMRKASAQLRRDVAALKRENASLKRKVEFLEKREKRRLDEPTKGEGPPEGSRFSTRSLKAQRRRTGLSQADYGRLIGVSTLTMNNWENGKTRPSPKFLARIVEIRGLGKREAERRLALVD